MNNIFPLKHPDASFPVAFDFSGYSLDLTGATVAVSVLLGEDLTPSSVLVGALQIDAGVVSQRVAAGVYGAQYLLLATATDGVNTWTHEHILPVGGIR